MTRIYLNGYGWVNVKEGTSFPVNFSVEDVQDILSTNSGYSKLITLSGDKETSKTLGQAFDVNVSESSFDRNKKVGCFVEEKEMQSITGVFFQLLKVRLFAETSPNDSDEVEYIGIIKENISSLFKSMKNRDLDDLQLFDPSQYEVLNKANIKSRYLNDYTSLWKYTLTGIGAEESVITVKQFRPSIFVRYIWDQIHKEAGFDWEMDEAADIKFNDLLIPFSGVYNPSEDTKRRGSVQGIDTAFHQYTALSNPVSGALQGYNTSGGTPYGNNYEFNQDIKNNNITFDLFSQWDNVTDVFTAEYTSNYSFNISFDLDVVIENFITGNIQLWNGGAGNNLTFRIFLRIRKSGTGIFADTNEITINIPEGTLYSSGLNTIASGTFDFTADLDVSSGEDVEIEAVMVVESDDLTIDNKFRDISTGNNVNIGFYLNMNETEFDIVPQLDYNVGSPIYMQEFIPKGIRQKDFVKSLIDFYKLMPTQDLENDNKIIYKTRDKFYDDGVQKNWTKKLAKGKLQELQFIQDKQKKRIDFTYTEDKDVWNTNYLAAEKEVFGRYRFNFENEYNEGTDEFKIIFSPTPILYSQDSRNLYIPAIGSMNAGSEDRNIRLLLDNGVRTDGNFQFLDDDGIGTTTETDYPFAAHWDDPLKPSFDLNFGVCRRYFYNGYQTTFNTITRMFHRRYLGQLSEGKILTAYFQLTPADIRDFNLSDKIWIRDAMFNVNRIIDYDANSDKLTKVELITVDSGIETNISFEKPPFRPPIGDPITNESYNDFISDEVTAMNLSGGNNNMNDVHGEGNKIQKNAKVQIFGDNNQANRSGTIIIGNRNKDSNGNKLMIGNDLESDVFYDMFVRNAFMKALSVEKLSVGGQSFAESKIIDIGAWDMDAVGNVNINHGLSASEFQNIVSVNVIIFNDGLTQLFDASSPISFNNEIEYLASTTVVRITRLTAGFFDNTSFDDATINRGFIKIDFKSA